MSRRSRASYHLNSTLLREDLKHFEPRTNNKQQTKLQELNFLKKTKDFSWHQSKRFSEGPVMSLSVLETSSLFSSRCIISKTWLSVETVLHLFSFNFSFCFSLQLWQDFLRFSNTFDINLGSSSWNSSSEDTSQIPGLLLFVKSKLPTFLDWSRHDFLREDLFGWLRSIFTGSWPHPFSAECCCWIIVSTSASLWKWIPAFCFSCLQSPIWSRNFH